VTAHADTHDLKIAADYLEVAHNQVVCATWGGLEPVLMSFGSLQRHRRALRVPGPGVETHPLPSHSLV
jgi:hypothetical protein